LLRQHDKAGHEFDWERCVMGSIGVNGYLLDMRAAVCGLKASGLGRELGPEGLAAYQVLKSIYRVGPAPSVDEP
jgi:acyl-CoA reductase-like NAD-dependent aldehyde dehydrogenase